MVSLQGALSQERGGRAPPAGPAPAPRRRGSGSGKREKEKEKVSQGVEALERRRWRQRIRRRRLLRCRPTPRYPLPPEWQRCLDIQSGKIHFYNTRTQRRTSRDPRRSAADEPPPVSLDLELNLTCETSPPSCPSGGGMVAAVCGRCHMLVMMSRLSLPAQLQVLASAGGYATAALLKPEARALVL
ncbi:unnamed protein product [Spirodela intermedia]|uniref:WW domain-containing protein n=1 Tax=Spirodela intermedia TaxID=51605 RepID=A0A7I8J4Q2_SPIIN|nr:unnamed protein product [Spirodela intermedia]CAA6665040.1 unnamed protein product [Spirodela intermedia]